MSSLVRNLPAFFVPIARGDLLQILSDPTGTPDDKKSAIEFFLANLPDLDTVTFKSNVDLAAFLQVLANDDSVVLNVDTVNERFGVGLADPAATVHAILGGATFAAFAGTTLITQNNGDVGDGNIWSIIAGNTGTAQLTFGDAESQFTQRIIADNNNNAMSFNTNGALRLLLDNAGNMMLGPAPGVEPTAGGGIVFVFQDNAGDPTMASNTAGGYAKDVAGTVERFAIDEAGNVAQLTSHPQDAPAAFYLPGDELPAYIQKSFNIYLGKFEWFRPSTSLQAYETFAAYNARRSLVSGHPEFMVQRDWTEQQEIQVARSEAEHADWQAASDLNAAESAAWEAGDQTDPEPEPFEEPEPVIYVAQEPPQSLQDRGVTLKTGS